MNTPGKDTPEYCPKIEIEIGTVCAFDKLPTGTIFQVLDDSEMEEYLLKGQRPRQAFLVKRIGDCFFHGNDQSIYYIPAARHVKICKLPETPSPTESLSETVHNAVSDWGRS